MGTEMDNVFEQVEKNIDNLVRNSVDWTASATKEELDAARNGRLVLRFWDREVPREWLKDIRGKRVLCLAGAAGKVPLQNGGVDIVRKSHAGGLVLRGVCPVRSGHLDPDRLHHLLAGNKRRKCGCQYYKKLSHCTKLAK